MGHVMKQSSRKPSTLTDGDLKARRERNRLAQHVSRKRRQAAEDTRTRRIQQLEDIVEEMTGVFVGVCDKMLETEETARQPTLIACLQSSVTRILTLAREATSTDGDCKTPKTEPRAHDNSDALLDLVAESCSRHTYSSLPQASPDHPTTTAEGDSTDIPPSIDPDSSDSTSLKIGSHPVMSVVQQLWPPTRQQLWDMSSLPLHLFEITLSRALFYLNGVMYLPAAEFQRVFGWTLRFHTREHLIAHMQWLLGPGRSDMYRMAEMTWGSIHSGRDEDLPIMLPSSLEDSTRQDSPADGILGHASDSSPHPEYLTTRDVHDRLQSLGAKMVDSDLLEFSIGHSVSSGADNDEFVSASCAPSLLHSRKPGASACLVVRLSLSLLTTNLTKTAMCLVKRPVYPWRGFVKAVEASITLARGG